MPITEDKNNAPAPEIMFTELVNTMVAKCAGKISVHKANEVVTAMLEKQMRYYAEMAETEVDKSAPDFVMAVGELAGTASAVISIGANFVQFMSEEQKRSWQYAATRLRNTCKTFENMV